MLIIFKSLIASAEEVNLSDPHPPHLKAIEAFEKVLPQIKSAIVKSRHDWDKVNINIYMIAVQSYIVVVIVSMAHATVSLLSSSHAYKPSPSQHEPLMWSRAHGISDHALTAFDLSQVKLVTNPIQFRKSDTSCARAHLTLLFSFFSSNPIHGPCLPNSKQIIRIRCSFLI